jgi:uncharacterized protein YyaL (SSP411 family)
MPNRLARERSPYLLQHANNPVDWYPWGDDAFAAARAQDRPIFLSIGYSTCHWCHVMEHESFEDASIADVLNRDFISIKVDREERPDVDRVYMLFVQATTGAGGWPMSVWLTPDLKPFFGGTYFPPESRWGRPGFVDVLAQLARAWHHDRAQVLQSADTMIERLQQFSAGGDGAPVRAPVAERQAIDIGVQAFAQTFDRRHGGFGGAPKFPRPVELLFLLNAHAFTGDQAAKPMALDTLHAMALGGMRDHVGGGFHRYSVDAEWRVPHFEKMLYDQAQLVLAYLDAAQASGEELYGAIAEDTLRYVLRDLTSPDGGFFSAEDADSLAPGTNEKKEGAFYVWSAGEIDRRLGDDAAVVRRRFGIEDHGNALADPQGEFTGENLLYVAQSIDEIAARTARSPEEVMTALVRARETLLRARADRPRPHLDDKIITAWNGLMIAAMARAARVLVDSPDRRTWRDAAVRAAELVQRLLWQPDRGRLRRRYRDGEAAIDGFCEDYACLAWGLIELFQATGDGRWLAWAADLTAVQGELFFDETDGGWFSTTGDDPTVLLRLKEDYDGAEPAAGSVTVRNLIVLGQLLADGSLHDRAGRTLERYGPQIGQVVRVMPLMASNVALFRARRSEIVIVGPAGREDTVALERAVASRYLPFAVIVPLDPSRREGLDRLPWLASMTMREDRATAYVCQDFSCQQPVTTAEALERQLELASAERRIII